jgi:hypothetical protein
MKRLVVFAWLAACAGAEVEREPARAIAPPLPASVEPARLAEARQPEPAFVDLCGQAYACCRAYIDSLPGGHGIDPEAACGAIQTLAAQHGSVAKQSCELMIDGWTQGLAAAGRPVPDVCRRGRAIDQPTVQVSPASSNP